jgi:hypothetical protein
MRSLQKRSVAVLVNSGLFLGITDDRSDACGVISRIFEHENLTPYMKIDGKYIFRYCREIMGHFNPDLLSFCKILTCFLNDITTFCEHNSSLISCPPHLDLILSRLCELVIRRSIRTVWHLTKVSLSVMTEVGREKWEINGHFFQPLRKLPIKFQKICHFLLTQIPICPVYSLPQFPLRVLWSVTLKSTLTLSNAPWTVTSHTKWRWRQFEHFAIQSVSIGRQNKISGRELLDFGKTKSSSCLLK